MINNRRNTNLHGKLGLRVNAGPINVFQELMNMCVQVSLQYSSSKIGFFNVQEGLC